MGKIIADATGIIGGHIRNEGGTGFTLQDFTDYAEHLVSTGRGNGLVKFGNMKTEVAGVAKERKVLRLASIKLDGMFAYDIKNPLFRTRETKNVNNDVRKTFINALIKNGDCAACDVRNLLKEDSGVNLADYVGEKGVAEIKNSKTVVTLAELAEMVGKNGTGKPLSARDILAMVDAAKYSELGLEVRQNIDAWGGTLRENVFGNPNLNDKEKLEKVKQYTNALRKMVVDAKLELPPWAEQIMKDTADKLESLDLAEFMKHNAFLSNPVSRKLVAVYKKAQEDALKKLNGLNNDNQGVEGPAKQKDGLSNSQRRAVQAFGAEVSRLLSGKMSGGEWNQAYFSCLRISLIPNSTFGEEYAGAFRSVIDDVGLELYYMGKEIGELDFGKLVEACINKNDAIKHQYKERMDQDPLLAALKEEFNRVLGEFRSQNPQV